MTGPAPSLREGLRPLVIVGAARSGTKFLQRVLGASRACRTIPFDVTHVWCYGHLDHPDDALPRAFYDERTARAIRRMLVRLAGLRPRDPARYLVEKTCSNTLRLPYVDAVVPDALYVHLVRDGRDAAASAYRRWNRAPRPAYLLGKLRYLPPSTFGFGLRYLGNLLRGRLEGRPGARIWGPRYPGMAADVAALPPVVVCARQWQACVETALRDLAALIPERVLTVRYEELVAGPETLERILAFMALPDADAVRAYYRETVETGSVGSWRRLLSDGDLDLILPLLEPTLHRLGYL